MPELIVNLDNEKTTNDFGIIISELIEEGDIIFLDGEMGSGKTFLARSIISNLLEEKFKGIEIPSPTFTLIQQYKCKNFVLGHADLYRIKNNNELDALGIEDILKQGCLLVEWPEKIKELYENNTLEIKFKDFNGRKSIELKNIKGWDTRLKMLENNGNG
ncbi:MAG: tRNA (adenosine(37)-N6)-threonylcarbamoyltransferase complex ATPase subunit type 1 TsaE [Rhodobiaceae bacterium]|mgnify:FL=1|nr:tRNA (adenosine(37)-N6)-threonylcarbamoyltransferase complex ATPase subunit type 1 TsaE [Rhodobiaceae bacterium]